MKPSTIAELHLDATLTGSLFFTAPKRLVSSRRGTEPAELMIMIDGVYRARTNDSPGVEIRAEAGDVVLWLERSERIEISDPAHPVRCLAVYFNWPGGVRSLPRVVHDSSLLIRLLGMRLTFRRQGPTTLPAVVWNTYLNAMLGEYIRLAETSRSSLVAAVLDHIERHMADPITLGDLAKATGLERHHFGRRFKKETGLTPMTYLRQCRADYALGMMATSGVHTIRHIYKRVGLRDEVQLRRLLRRCTGMSLRELKTMAARHRTDPCYWPAELLKPRKP